MYKIPEFYVIFAQKMPEFYVIIAQKVFFLNFRGTHAPSSSPPPVSYAYGQPRWLATYVNGLPVCKQSPIPVVTGPGVD